MVAGGLRSMPSTCSAQMSVPGRSRLQGVGRLIKVARRRGDRHRLGGRFGVVGVRRSMTLGTFRWWGRSAPRPMGLPTVVVVVVVVVAVAVAVSVPSEEPHAVALTAMMSNGARRVQREIPRRRQ